MTKLSFSHNWGLKIVSLLIGLSVFVYVNSLELAKESNTRDVPLVATELPSDLEIVGIPETIQVTLRAPFDVIPRRDLKDLQLRAYVDLQNAKPGVGNYRVRLIEPPDVKDVEYEYDQSVTIELQSIIEQTFPLNVEWPDGFESGTATPSASTILLRGPESELRRVSGARVKLKPSEALTGGTYSLAVEALDRNGKVLSSLESRPRNMSVNVVTSDALPKRDTIISPRFSGQPKFGYTVQSIKIDPPTVVVQGSRKAIIDLSTVETEAIKLDGLKQSTEFKVKLIEPIGLKLIGKGEVVVRVKIVRG